MIQSNLQKPPPLSPTQELHPFRKPIVRKAPQALLLSTAGGVIFAGTDDGYFKALDAKTGKQLWYLNLGGPVRASPMTYATKGRQRVAIASRNGLFVFGLPE